MDLFDKEYVMFGKNKRIMEIEMVRSVCSSYNISSLKDIAVGCIPDLILSYLGVKVSVDLLTTCCFPQVWYDGLSRIHKNTIFSFSWPGFKLYRTPTLCKGFLRQPTARFILNHLPIGRVFNIVFYTVIIDHIKTIESILLDIKNYWICLVGSV